MKLVDEKTTKEKLEDIEKLSKEPNTVLLWYKYGSWLVEQAERLSELEKTDCSVCDGRGHISPNRPNVKCYQCYGSGIIYV